MGYGGKRENAGHKPKAEEIQLIERLSPMADAAFKALEKGVMAGEFPYVKLFIEYYAGKPRERVDITSMGEKINNAIEVTVIRTTLDKGSD